MTKMKNKKEDDNVIVVGSRQTTTTKGKYNTASTSGETFQEDDDDDDDGVADLRESLPLSTLPDTQLFMARLLEHKPDWDDFEEDDDDEEVEKWRRKALAESLSGRRDENKDNITK
jgi:hypothetical protein